MTFGIQPESVNEMSTYEISIYALLIPLYFEFLNKNMENCIKKAIGELFGG